MNYVVVTLATSFLIGSSSFLQATSKTYNISNGFEIQQDPIRDL